MNNLLKTYNFNNFEIVKGNGCYLYTSDNRRLLDFSAGVAVNSLGYNHSVIKKTLQEQLKTYSEELQRLAHSLRQYADILSPTSQVKNGKSKKNNGSKTTTWI